MSLIQRLCEKSTFHHGVIRHIEKVITKTETGEIISMYQLQIEYINGELYEHEYFPGDEIQLYLDEMISFDCIIENNVRNIIFINKNINKHT